MLSNNDGVIKMMTDNGLVLFHTSHAMQVPCDSRTRGVYRRLAFCMNARVSGFSMLTFRKPHRLFRLARLEPTDGWEGFRGASPALLHVQYTSKVIIPPLTIYCGLLQYNFQWTTQHPLLSTNSNFQGQCLFKR